MPKYYVYDVQTGEIVHRHESYDGTSGESLPCSREDILAVVDDTLQRENLDVVEAEFEHQRAERAVRVDPQTRELVTGE